MNENKGAFIAGLRDLARQIRIECEKRLLEEHKKYDLNMNIDTNDEFGGIYVCGERVDTMSDDEREAYYNSLGITEPAWVRAYKKWETNVQKDNEQRNKYEKLGTEVGKLVASKRGQYGDALETVDSILCELYPRGISPEAFMNALYITRILEKICRITRGDGSGDDDAALDIAGHALLMLQNEREWADSDT